MRRLFTSLVTILLFSSDLFAQNPAELDFSFNASGVGLGGIVNTLVSQTDGKVVVGGTFLSINGTTRRRIARLNADGSLDTSFDPGLGVDGNQTAIVPESSVHTLLVQPDGKIVIAGRFTSYNSISRNRIARLNSNGSLDTSFDPGLGVNGGPEVWVSSLSLQVDGKIIIGGLFTSFDGTNRNMLARLNSNGSLDTSFNPGTGPDQSVKASIIQPDGKIIIGGDFTLYNSTGRSRIARLNSDGTLDNSFSGGPNSWVSSLLLQTDGKIVVGGNFSAYSGNLRNGIARINMDGSLDNSFVVGTGATFDFIPTQPGVIWTSVLQNDGKIIIGGSFSSYNGTSRLNIARINSDGSLDTSFDPGTGANSTVRTTVLRTDGKVVIGGDFQLYRDFNIIGVARLLGTIPLAIEPAGQPSSLAFSSVTEVSMNTSFVVAPGTGGYLALRKTNSAPTFIPQDRIVYPNGSTVGDAIVAYNGTANSFSNTGLASNSTYHYAIYSYNGTGEATNYLMGSPLTGSRATLVVEPTTAPSSLNFPTLAPTSLGGSFSPTAADGYIVLQRPNASPTGTPQDGTTYSVGNSIGDGNVIAVGAGTTFIASSLNANTVYHYDVIAYNGSGNIINYNTTSRLEGSRTTLQTEPTVQPTALIFSNITINSQDASFTAAGGVDGYVVLRRPGSAPTFVPVDGTVYVAGTTQGDAQVMSVGSATSFSNTGLTANTVYHYAVYSYRGVGQTTNYLTTSPLVGSRSTLVNEPASAPTVLTFPTFATTSLGGSFIVTTADGYLVLQRATSSPTGTPVDGITYTVGNTIGDGTVVGVGAGTTFTASSLTANTVYHYDVIAYNGSGNIINYNTTSRLEGSRTTLQTEPTAQATSITFNNITVSSLSSSFTAATGSPTGYLVLRREDVAPTGSPVDGFVYTVGNAIGDGTVVFAGGATAFSDAGLVAGKVYVYRIFSYNGAGAATNYLSANPSGASTITICSAPTANAATTVSQTSFQANWSAVTGAANYLLDVSQDNFSNLLPGYAGKAVVGLNDAVTGLTPGVTYQYRVRASNASGLSSNSATINQLTLPATPLATAATSLSPTSFVANWSPVVSATGYFLDVATDPGFTSFQVGYNNLSVTNTFQSVTGLTSGVTFYYRVRAVNATGLSPSSIVIETATITTEPLAQPTAITFSNLNSSSLTVSFSSALGSPVGYLALMKEGSAPTEVPQDGTSYTVGATVGTSRVAHVGSATTFSVSSLNPNAVYHFAIFSYNGSGLSINYLTSNPLAGSRTTLEIEPTNQPTLLSFLDITDTSLNASFTAAAGVDGYLVIRRTGSAPTGTPADGTAYTTGNAVGDGTVVFVGSGVSFSQSSLVASTTYHYSVFAYRGSGAAINYLTSSPLTGSRSTLASEPASAPTVLTFPTFTTNSLGGSFTATTADGYLVLQRATDSPTGTAVDGITYTVGNTVGDGTVVAVGAATTFSASALTANTVYHYDVIAYNGSGNIINYNTTSRLEGSRTTLQTEPTAQATSVTFNNITVSSLSGSFTAATGSPTGYLVLRREDVAPTGSPTDGLVYTAGNTIGDGAVVFASGATAFSDAGLVAGKVYVYRIFSYNGAGAATNYLSANPGAASTITICSAPTANAATSVSQTSFQANWSAVTGAANYILDVSQDNFSNLLPGYASKTVVGLNDAVTGLTSGVTYQYRVRASNASGVSDNSSVIEVLTIPPTPVANTATAISSNDFKASWNSVPSATSYQVDVSANNFVSLLPGYNGKSVSAPVTEETIFGLSPGTQYQYRVRAINGTGASPNSNTISVTTLAGGGTTPLAIGAPVFQPSFAQNATSQKVSVTVTGGVGVRTVTFFHRPVSGVTFQQVAAPPTAANANSFEVEVLPAMLDELGVEFYFSVSTPSASEATSRFVMRRSFSGTATPAISSIKAFGGTLESYQIISIPYVLEDNLIQSVFGSVLGEYDDTKWRIVRYQNGANVDFPAINRIELGKSYWFNSVQEVSINTGNVSSVAVSQTSPYALNLVPGWNQIATPFPFAIDWDDVLAANSNPTGVGKYRVYVPGSASFTDSNVLQPFSGGFVFTERAQDLTLPVSLKATSGGRTRTSAPSSDIGSDAWQVDVNIRQGHVVNTLSGFGMHPAARPGKDDFDDITLPRFVKHLEMNSYHPEFFAPRFSRDVVQTRDQHQWTFALESNFKAGEITLDWSAHEFGTNEAQLLLFDPVAGRLIDMKRVKQYTVPDGPSRELRFFYFRTPVVEMDAQLALGQAYPNPSARQVHFDVFAPEAGQVQLEIVDVLGRKVHEQSAPVRAHQVHQLTWGGTRPSGEPVEAALYVYRIRQTAGASNFFFNGRVLIK